MPKPTIHLKTVKGQPILSIVAELGTKCTRAERVERAMLSHLTGRDGGSFFEDQLETIKLIALAHGWDVTVDGK